MTFQLSLYQILSLYRESVLRWLTVYKGYLYTVKGDNCLFVCVEVLRPSQLNGVMSSAVSLPIHTFTGQV